MKKVFLFLSIIMFAFTGVLFACGGDRYADLKIEPIVIYNDTSVVAEEGYVGDKKISYYSIPFGETFNIYAKTHCSSDISHAVLFDSLSDTSVNYISKQDKDDGSLAIFKAVAPSYDNYFKINLRSVETSKNSTSVYIKVVLPIASISLQDNLALTSDNDVDLEAFTTYTSTVPSSPFETNQKGATYSLKTFTDSKTSTKHDLLVCEQTSSSVTYGTDENTPVFKLENNKVAVLDESLEGILVAEVISVKYDFEMGASIEGLEEDQLTDEQKANEGLKGQANLYVVKGISLEDISFIGGQVGFNFNSANPKSANSKLDASLFINCTESYTIGNNTYKYHAEQVDLSVTTNADISIKAEIGSIIDDEENEIVSDNNVISIENANNLELSPIKVGETTTGYNTLVKVLTEGGYGNAYVDFVIYLDGYMGVDFAKPVEYRFSELYKNYVVSLSDTDKASSSFDFENNKLNFYASALPSQIAIFQDGDKINTSSNAVISVFDSYAQSDNTSVYGTKISTQLTSQSGLTSVKIDDLNKRVKVYVSYLEDATVPVAQYLEIRNSNFNKVSLLEDKSNGLYYFELDLTKANSSYFYVRAVKNNLVANGQFVFELENIINSSISIYSGNTLNAGESSVKTPSNIKTSFNAKTLKGIEEVVALIYNSKTEEKYFEVDGKNLTVNELYKQVVLKVNESGDTTQNLGTILGIVVNAGANEALDIYVEDEEIAKIEKRNVSGSDSIFADYKGYKGKGGEIVLQFNEGINLVGCKVGTTKLYIKSSNGYCATVDIKVVNQIDNENVLSKFSVKIEQSYSDIVTEDTLNSIESKKYISAKVGGNFQIVYTVKPDSTSVVDVRYLVYKKGTYGVNGVTPVLSNIININQQTGGVTSNTVGQATIVVQMFYYVFEAKNGNYEWIICETPAEIVFDATIYEPATSIRLNKFAFKEGEIYDRNSLSYTDEERATVSINVIIEPTGATIANDPSRVRYEIRKISGNEGENLLGSDGVYTAYLLEGQTKTTVWVDVYIKEFGNIVVLSCEVVITKAPQIQSIDYSAFDGDNKLNIENAAWNENYSYLSTKNNKTLKFFTNIYPASKDVLVDDLVVSIFKPNDSSYENLSTNVFDKEEDYKAVLNYNSERSKQTIQLQNGVDSFELKIDDTQSGYFYLVIFAKDSMTSATKGKVVEIICIEITNGTVENPFTINTLNEFLDINSNPSSHYVLGANINLGSIANWTPLKPLTGSLNGYNSKVAKFYTISGLKINKVNGANVGLFEAISNQSNSIGAVLNLKVVVSYIRITPQDNLPSEDEINIGIIAGVNNGVIYNCAVEASVYEVALGQKIEGVIVGKKANVGGFVGLNKGGIINTPIAYSYVTSDNGVENVDLSTLKYSKDGAIDSNLISDNITNVNTITDENYVKILEDFFVSTNPINVNMTINDIVDIEINNVNGSTTTYQGFLNAGGIAGKQEKGGFINGLYGVYADIEERLIANSPNNGGQNNTVNYLTSYQSQGVDVSININKIAGNIVNASTRLGGVVGYNFGGLVYNVSAQGQIGRFEDNEIKGALNYVGGIVGLEQNKVSNTSTISAIKNVSASVKLRANNMVGGAIGNIENSNVELIRVESYQDFDNTAIDAQTLIIANGNVGGVIGRAINSKIHHTYSYSYIDNFNSKYIQMGDIFVINNSVSGGILGLLTDYDDNSDDRGKKVSLTQSYSTFNIVTKSSTAQIAGIVGDWEQGAIEKIGDVFYIGVLQGVTDEKINALTSATLDSQTYNYYYLLKYQKLDDDSYVLVKKAPIADWSSTANSSYNASKNYSFSYSIVGSDGKVTTETQNYKMLTYTSPTSNATFDFIRSIADSINVGVNEENVCTIENNTLPFDDSSKKYFYSYTDNEGVLHLIALYKEGNSSIDLNNLFKIIPSPSIAGKINILVQSKNTSIISISNTGILTIKGLGKTELVFKVRENNAESATKKVIVDIVENFDKLLVSDSLSFTEGFLDGDKTISVNKNTAINLFALFGEYVDLNNSSSYIFYEIIENQQLGLIQIANITGYKLIFEVYNQDGQTLADASQYNANPTDVTFYQKGDYVVKMFVTFELGEGNNKAIYTLTNENWIYYVTVKEGATHIKFDIQQAWLAGNEAKPVQVILTTDIEFANEEEAVNGLDIFLNYDDVDDNNSFSYVKKSFNSNLPVTLTYVEGSYKQVGNVHHYDFMLKVAEDHRYLTQTFNHTLYALDAQGLLGVDHPDSTGDNRAKLSITIAPQGVSGLAGIHYAYTQEVSKVEANVNTGADTEDENYSYSFTNEPKDTIVAGGEGLFVIDLYPYYSNITSVSVHSSMGTAGNSLQFVQLVKIKNSSQTDGYSYIYGPQTSASEQGGISLNLYSYVDDEVATVIVNDGVYKINYKTGYTSLKNSYRFDDKKLSGHGSKVSDGSEIGRLYVKTVAPTNISDEREFTVYVTVNYRALNEANELVDMQKVYEHKLIVESMPGFNLKVSHEGKERSVIAYTAGDKTATEDYLDVVPMVTDGYTYDSITAALFETSSNTDLEIKAGSPDAKHGGEYYILENISGGIRLRLGPQANVGDTILISVSLTISFDGYIQKRNYTTQIKVVDIVIESVSIEGLDGDSNLKLTVSTSKQLKVKINGFGTSTAILEAENQISRSISYENNSINYWYAKSSNTGEYYVNLDSVNIKNNLPFLINKVAIISESSKSTYKVDSNAIGASKSQKEMEFSILPKLVVLEGSTSSGTSEMLLRFSYVYLDKPYNHNQNNSETKLKKGQIVFVPNTFDTDYVVEKYFKVIVTEESNEDNPTPVYNEADLRKMASSTGGDYILMNDITIRNHEALNASFTSFDGNNKIIKIENFAYSTNLGGTNSNYSINMGLFNTVSANTMIKNVIVALPADKEVAMDLRGYTTINFGGIAAINQGVITNCDVISVTNSTYTLSDYLNSVGAYANLTDLDAKNNFTYALNIETYDDVSGKEVNANIGLLVGQNQSTGFITNSRVGREKVEILSVYDSESTVVYKSNYAYTAPATFVKVYGMANFGGFVASNAGTISSSYVKNVQLEIVSQSRPKFVKTGGFVVTNNGFIHGSYVAGWEEENLAMSMGNITSSNRKLGGGIYSNGFIGGFVYTNAGFIEDSYSNINISGSLTFAAKTSYIQFLKASDWISPNAGGFVYISKPDSEITTSYSLSKIDTSFRSNTHGIFEGRMESSDDEFDNSGEVSNCYFMQEKGEEFTYDYERAVKLTDDPVVDLGGSNSTTTQNEFIIKGSFNNYSFDNNIEDFSDYNGESMGGVWAIYKPDGLHGYPELISANTVAVSCRVINVTKTNASETNKFYYTYVDGYEIGSTKNPYIVSNFKQFNNIFKDTVKADTNNFNDNVSTKFTGNIRLVKHINFENSEEVYSTSVEYTSLLDLTSIFDGNYLAMYNITLADNTSGKTSFGLFKDIYYAGVKNLTLIIDKVSAGNVVTVGALAGAIVNSNISNVTLISSTNTTGIVTGNNYVGGLAGIIVSNDKEHLFTISNIKSNLSIVGGVSTSQNVTAIPTSEIVWEKIKPTASSSGLSELNANLRLHRLPVNVYYAGGIAGILDLHQVDEGTGELELNDINAYNIHVGEFSVNTNLESTYVSYLTNVSVISDYSGGLFGMIGVRTYLECAEFIANNENANHFISAKEIAGGIAAVNFGKISQSYVSYTKEQTNSLNTDIVEYLKQEDLTSNLHINTTLFSAGTPKYIGGIAGINIGNGDYGSGYIVDCYNRLDVRNTSAKGVGGIVGGSYIGQISNVYTTASLLGDLEDDNTKIGAIIGKIFFSDEDFDEGYFADYQNDNSGASDNLVLLNIVALNLWYEEDFDELYQFAKINSIGALYGKFDNISRDEEGNEDFDRFVKIDANSGIFIQNYAFKNFNDPDISKETLDVENDIEDKDSYFELWGMSTNTYSTNYNEFLYNLFAASQSKESLITPNKYKALFSGTEYGVSTLRITYFPAIKWSRAIWNYDDDKVLPVLEYGYETSVIRIYTANQFNQELASGSTSGKLYVIMNDIDFSGIDINPIIPTFRGQLHGNNVKYVENGIEYSREPILFNVRINAKPEIKNSVTVDPNAKYAIFSDSVGATFANFSIVLSEYNLSYSHINDQNIASVLVANAVDTTVNNVHIYSSLLLKYNEELNQDNVKFDSAASNRYITSAKYYDPQANHYKLSSPFLKVAAFNNKVDTMGFTPIEFLYKLQGGKFIPDKYTGNGKVDQLIDLTNDDMGISSKSISTNSATISIRNANYVGLLIGTSSLSYVDRSSVNIAKISSGIEQVQNISVSYTALQNNNKPQSIFVGTLIGRNIGEVRNVVGKSKLSITNFKIEDSQGNQTPNSFAGANIGGIVGSHNGIIRNAYVKNSTINVGTDSIPFVANSGHDVVIGGAFGSVNRYTTLNESVVGGTDYLYLFDCKINAYVSGNTMVGGAIGNNSFTIGNIYNKQTTNDHNNPAINVTVHEASSIPYMVGGILGQNLAGKITNAYTNASIKVDVKRKNNEGLEYSLNVGGIIGSTKTSVDIINVVNDSDFIKIDNGSKSNVNLAPTGMLYAGGLVGEAEQNALVGIYDAITTADITATQEKQLAVGGAIGRAQAGLVISSGIVLGDIKLLRSNKAPDGTLFYKDVDVHRVGGLVGALPSGKGIVQANANINNKAACDFVVFSTIRDYALAQKTNLEIGPVIGANQKESEIAESTKFNIAYNEAISLVSNNGYSTSNLQNISQVDELNGNKNLLVATCEAYKKLYKEYTENIFDVYNSQDFYSKCNEKYFDVLNFDVTSTEYNGPEGSKLNPIIFNSNSQFTNGKYYVLNGKIQSTIETNSTNWVLNAQGNVSSVYPVFDTITEGSAVVGLLVNNTNESQNAGVANTNYGFIFSCGVAGNIKGDTPSSIVDANYGVISTSFSIANLHGKFSAGGLVINNGGKPSGGSQNYIGNIYSSYYTGSIYPTQSGGNYAGLALNLGNNNGVISNSYTMAHIDTTKFNVKAFPVIWEDDEENTIEPSNTYKTFYDYVAYTGEKEGVNLATASRTNNLTSGGIYVWSSALTGGEFQTDDISIVNIFEGNWLAPGDETYLKDLYKTSSLYNAERDGSLEKLDTSWFNYGYTTNNFANILVGKENVTNYFNMLYTGNGLASKEDAGKTSTYGLPNMPYQVKHAGIFELLVAGNNTDDMVLFKYYLFTNDISFEKYTGETYWSKNWDDAGIVFVGDLDGGYKLGGNTNKRRVLNMFASYGLVRAIPSSNDSRKTTVRNITIENCYSKTALVNGYMGTNSIIYNVNATNCLVYNGDISGLKSGIFADRGYSSSHSKYTQNKANNGNFAELNFNSMNYKYSPSPEDKLANINANFAGGLVGYMNGGSIESSCSLSNTYVVASDVNAKATNNSIDTYIGGLVGCMMGGTIGTTSNTWDFGNTLTVSASLNTTTKNSYVGGVVGYLSAQTETGIIQNVNVNNVTINGSYAVGGIVGRLNGGELKNNTYKNSSNIQIKNTKIIDKTNGFSVAEARIEGVTSTFVGGIVGLANEGQISNCKIESYAISLNVDSMVTVKTETSDTKLALGGVVGLLDGAEISNGGVEKQNIKIDANSGAYKQKVVGGIAGIMQSGKISNTTYTGTAGDDEKNNISGGIVGIATNGTISNSDASTNATIYSSDIAGGIVGIVVAKEQSNRVSISHSDTVNDSVKVFGKQYAGGIVGKVEASADLTSTEDGYRCKISSCINYATVETENNNTSPEGQGQNTNYQAAYGMAGGIVGYITGFVNSNSCFSVLVEYSTNDGVITTKNASSNLSLAGGIAGFASCTKIVDPKNLQSISNAYIAGGVVAYARNVKIVGEHDSVESKNINATQIAGGIVGYGFDTEISLKSEIKNIIQASSFAGGVAGVLEGESSVTGEFTVYEDAKVICNGGIAGGIIGYANGATLAQQCKIYNESVITGYVAGGIVGYVQKLINNSLSLKNEATVTATGNKGIILNKGYSFASDILKYSSTGNSAFVSLPSNIVAGGIIGCIKQDITLLNVENTGSITAETGLAGGIIGEIISSNGIEIIKAKNSGTVSGNVAGGVIAIAKDGVKIGFIVPSGDVEPITDVEVINSGDITAVTFAGGIVGKLEGGNIFGLNIKAQNLLVQVANSGKITSQYNTAGTNPDDGGAAGGIVGLLSNNGKINYVSNAGDIIANNSHAGGIIGYMNGGTLGDEIADKDDEAKDNSTGGNIISSSGNAGGVVGYTSGGTIEYNIWQTSGTIKVSGVNAGGLIGSKNDTNMRALSGDASQIKNIEGTESIGGLVGYMSGGNISDKEFIYEETTNGEPIVQKKVYKTKGAEITSGGKNSGGLVGYMEAGTIEGGTGGNVTTPLNQDTSYVGGLAGYMNSGNIKGGVGGIIKVEAPSSSSSSLKTTYAGGFVGYMASGNIMDGTGVQFEESENKYGIAGIVTYGPFYAGGMVGYMEAGTVSGGIATSINLTGSTSTSDKIGYLGGLIGYMKGGVINGEPQAGGVNASPSGGSNGSNVYAGGLVGFLTGSEETKINGGIGNNVKVTISGSPKSYGGGFVGYMDGGSIYNAKTEASISAGNSAGGFVGYMNAGLITNGESQASLTAGTSTGGIVGHMYSGEIKGGAGTSANKGTNAGGVVGYMEGGTIRSGSGGSASAPNAGGVAGYMKGGTIVGGGTMSVQGSNNAGGIVGLAEGGIIACNPVAIVNGGNAGGVVGKTSGTVTISINNVACSSITGSSSSGAIVGYVSDGQVGLTSDAITIENACLKGSTENKGYLVGLNKSTIGGISQTTITIPSDGDIPLTQKNEGKIANITVSVSGGGFADSESGSSDSFGAIARENSGTIYNCKNTSSIQSTSQNIGGIVGYNKSTGIISSCTNSGKIEFTRTTGGCYIGGIVGKTDGNVNGINSGDIIAVSPEKNANSTNKATSRTNGTSNFFNQPKYSGSSPTSYAGGIAGYVSNGVTEGKNTSTNIYNIVKYTSSASSASIVDYRGQIAGYKSSVGSVKNLNGHTKLTADGPTKEYDKEEYVILNYQTLQVENIDSGGNGNFYYTAFDNNGSYIDNSWWYEDKSSSIYGRAINKNVGKEWVDNNVKPAYRGQEEFSNIAQNIRNIEGHGYQFSDALRQKQIQLDLILNKLLGYHFTTKSDCNGTLHYLARKDIYQSLWGSYLAFVNDWEIPQYDSEFNIVYETINAYAEFTAQVYPTQSVWNSSGFNIIDEYSQSVIWRNSDSGGGGYSESEWDLEVLRAAGFRNYGYGGKSNASLTMAYLLKHIKINDATESTTKLQDCGGNVTANYIYYGEPTTGTGTNPTSAGSDSREDLTIFDMQSNHMISTTAHVPGTDVGGGGGGSVEPEPTIPENDNHVDCKEGYEIAALHKLYKCCGKTCWDLNNDDIVDTGSEKPDASVTDTVSISGHTHVSPGTANMGSGFISTSEGSHGYVWPIDLSASGALDISSPFGNRIHPIYGTTDMHKALDIGASKGSAIVAARAGKVAYVSKCGCSTDGCGNEDHANYVGHQSGGNNVKINHYDDEGNLIGYTQYLHMLGNITVSAGDNVEANQVIGYVGSTGSSTGPHLDFRLWVYKGQGLKANQNDENDLEGYINYLKLFPELEFSGTTSRKDGSSEWVVGSSDQMISDRWCWFEQSTDPQD